MFEEAVPLHSRLVRSSQSIIAAVRLFRITDPPLNPALVIFYWNSDNDLMNKAFTVTFREYASKLI